MQNLQMKGCNLLVLLEDNKQSGLNLALIACYLKMSVDGDSSVTTDFETYPFLTRAYNSSISFMLRRVSSMLKNGSRLCMIASAKSSTSDR
jgi:hypothetical protein